MFEVLVYLFENYLESNNRPDQDTLAVELSAAGFDEDDINGAFRWYDTLEAMTDGLSDQQPATSPSALGTRLYASAELDKIDTESFSFLLFLEQAQVLNAAQRELILDRAMALPESEVHINEMRWIVLMALWTQGKAKDYLFVEDAIFGGHSATLH